MIKRIEDQFVIVCVERSTGLDLMYWAPNDRGYVSDPRNAGIYTQAEIVGRPEIWRDDYPLPLSLAKAIQGLQ